MMLDEELEGTPQDENVEEQVVDSDEDLEYLHPEIEDDEPEVEAERNWQQDAQNWERWNMQQETKWAQEKAQANAEISKLNRTLAEMAARGRGGNQRGNEEPVDDFDDEAGQRPPQDATMKRIAQLERQLQGVQSMAKQELDKRFRERDTMSAERDLLTGTQTALDTVNAEIGPKVREENIYYAIQRNPNLTPMAAAKSVRRQMVKDDAERGIRYTRKRDRDAPAFFRGGGTPPTFAKGKPPTTFEEMEDANDAAWEVMDKHWGG